MFGLHGQLALCYVQSREGILVTNKQNQCLHGYNVNKGGKLISILSYNKLIGITNKL